jgi:hypothetical protein
MINWNEYLFKCVWFHFYSVTIVQSYVKIEKL